MKQNHETLPNPGQIVPLLVFMALFILSPGSVLKGENRNFYQKYLREARNSDSATRQNEALANTATRHKDSTIIKRKSQPVRVFRVDPSEIRQLLSQKPDKDTLNLALALKKRLNQTNIELEEFITIALWKSGQTKESFLAAQAVLAKAEIPSMRTIIFEESLKNGNLELAARNLFKSDLKGLSFLLALASVSLRMPDVWLLLAITVFIVGLIIKLRTELYDFIWRGCSIIFYALYFVLLTLPCSLASLAFSSIRHIRFPDSLKRKDMPQKDPSAPDAEPKTPETGKQQGDDFFEKLQTCVSEKMQRVIGFSSFGKHQQAVELAEITSRQFAGNDYGTLLIDASDSEPFLDTHLRQTHPAGLSDISESGCDYSSLIFKSEHENLSFLFCGKKGNNYQNLSLFSWQKLIEYCKNRFEIILIICPPANRVLSNRDIAKNIGWVFIARESAQQSAGKDQTLFIEFRRQLLVMMKIQESTDIFSKK